MIDPRCQPIAHHPPLKPISLRPVYPHAQTESRTFWEIQYEESIRIERGLRNEKMWRAVVEFAQGRGSVPASTPKAVEVVDTAPSELAPWEERAEVIPGSFEEFEQFMEGIQWTPEQIERMNDDQG